MSSFSELIATLDSFFTTGTIGFIQCQFSNPNWITCLKSGQILPASFLFGLVGFLKISTTQWGFFSTIDTPPVPESAEKFGLINVRPLYYVLDTLASIFWDALEATGGTIILLFLATGIVAWNAGTSSFYTFVGVAQIFSCLFHILSISIQLFYDAVNIDYLLRVYDTSTYTEIQFYNPANFISSKLDTLGLILYAEQLLLGNKRIGLYNNIFLSIVLSLHPISFIFSWYYLFQVPINVLLDLFIYPWFPQFDTPQINWQWYWAEVSYFTTDENSQYRQLDQSTDKDVKSLDKIDN